MVIADIVLPSKNGMRVGSYIASSSDVDKSKPNRPFLPIPHAYSSLSVVIANTWPPPALISLIFMSLDAK